MSLRAPFDRAHPELRPGVPAWRDPSFAALLGECPALAAVPGYLERAAPEPRIESLQSSYRDHGYGALLYALARALRPTTCVELGVLQGFSLLAVASALRDNGHGTIAGYDLFEDYPYRHETLETARGNIRACGLQDRAEAMRADAYDVHAGYASIDWLHADISNDGDTLLRLFAQWEAKVARVMIFEGGSRERDQVDWMLSHGKRPMAPVVEALRGAHPGWRFAVLAPYPSMTIALRAEACR
ncbi:MAG: class I SAM-dependent methyltransferase [Usitatibacter sp.]